MKSKTTSTLWNSLQPVSSETLGNKFFFEKYYFYLIKAFCAVFKVLIGRKCEEKKVYFKADLLKSMSLKGEIFLVKAH